MAIRSLVKMNAFSIDVIPTKEFIPKIQGTGSLPGSFSPAEFRLKYHSNLSG